MYPRHDPNGPAPSFAQQRMICFALLTGMALYAIVAAFTLHGNDGQGMVPDTVKALEWLTPVFGVATAVSALLLRRVLQQKADAKPPAERGAARFRATLIPLALIEGGCLFAITIWMMTGATVPHLVVAMVLLAIAIAIVPLHDPDDGDVSGRGRTH